MKTVETYRQCAGVSLHIAVDLNTLARDAARQFTTLGRAAIARAGCFHVALSGGSTPKAMFAALVADQQSLDWSKVHVYWGDERHVPPTDPESNYRMAKESLLDHVPVRPEQVHRIRAEDTAVAAARAYEIELQRLFALAPDAQPRFDLVLLGIGDEGHTASLFPDTEALRDETHIVIDNNVPKLNATRITLTYPAINAAAHVLALISGAAKSAIVREVLETAPDPLRLPMQGVQPDDGRVLWYLDAAAAAGLA